MSYKGSFIEVHVSKKNDFMLDEFTAMLKEIGGNVRTARLRRNIKIKDNAEIKSCYVFLDIGPNPIVVANYRIGFSFRSSTLMPQRIN